MVSYHLQDQREVFGSTSPNNHRRLGDDLERVQVQQAINVATPPNGTATTTVVTASATSATASIKCRVEKLLQLPLWMLMLSVMDKNKIIELRGTPSPQCYQI